MILGLGHPKTGTGFTAHLLFNNGIDVGHENLKREGMVSWLACVNRDDAPWNNKNYSDLDGDVKTFLVARSPLKSMMSVFAENNNDISTSWRRKVIFEEFGIDIFSPSIGQGNIAPAVASMFYWYGLCLSHDPQFIYRVDHIEDDEKLSNFVGKQLVRHPHVHKNSHPERYEGLSFHINDINNLSPIWINNLIDMCYMLGYEEDAEKVSKAIDKSTSSN